MSYCVMIENEVSLTRSKLYRQREYPRVWLPSWAYAVPTNISYHRMGMISLHVTHGDSTNNKSKRCSFLHNIHIPLTGLVVPWILRYVTDQDMFGHYLARRHQRILETARQAHR